MRIAFILMKFPVLSETFILNQITCLLDRGHEVDIFTTIPGGDETKHSVVDRYGLLARTSHIGVPGNWMQRVIKGAGLFFRHVCRKPRLILNSINVFRFGKQAASLRLLFMAARFTRRYDIVHCHYGVLGETGLILKKLKADIGSVITSFHGFDITEHVKRYGKEAYSNLFANGDLFLPISDNWRRRLLQLGCPENRIRVLRMGIDCSMYTCVPRKIGDDESLRILSVARLVEKKGLEYGIRAVSRAVRKGFDISYTIAGDGPMLGELTELVSRLGAQERIRLTGWKTQIEVRELMSRAHILLVPSVTAMCGDQEGIPVVLMEALAMGLPVISTEHSGIPELVEDGRSGFLVPERDENAIYEKIVFLRDHEEIWPEMGMNGRRRVEEKYNLEKNMDELESAYREALQPRQ